MSKVSYTKCDICDSEIIKGGYRLTNEQLHEDSKRSGGAIDVCEKCMESLTQIQINLEQYNKSEQMSKQIAPINLIARKKDDNKSY